MWSRNHPFRPHAIHPDKKISKKNPTFLQNINIFSHLWCRIKIAKQVSPEKSLDTYDSRIECGQSRPSSNKGEKAT
jgi:hypothetical protein